MTGVQCFHNDCLIHNGMPSKQSSTADVYSMVSLIHNNQQQHMQSFFFQPHTVSQMYLFEYTVPYEVKRDFILPRTFS